MNVRFAITAAAMLAAAPCVAAEPEQSARPAVHPESASPQLLLASADADRPAASASEQASNAPRRPRIARVTTCRCGDPQAEPQQDR